MTRYGAATFAAPGVFVDVNAQSAAALFGVLLVRDARQRAVDGVRVDDGVRERRLRRGMYVCPSIVAAVIAPSRESVEQRLRGRVDQRDAVRRAVLRLDVDCRKPPAASEDQ